MFRRDGALVLRTEGVEVRAGIELQFDLISPGTTGLDQTTTVISVTAATSVAPEEVKNSAFLIQGREVFKTAGSLQDVSRYVTSLPGVAGGSADFRNDIIVRGGSPLENLFIVDNIEVWSPAIGSRLYSSAPPTIPHRLQNRQQCEICHIGLQAPLALRAAHGMRANCLQCHAAGSE